MSNVRSFRSQSDYSQEQVTKMIDFADEQHIPLFDVMKRSIRRQELINIVTVSKSYQFLYV